LIFKIKFRCVSKYTNLLEIYDFCNIDNKYLRLLNDKILLNYPFIRYLNACNNPKITNINFMDKLIELNACGESEIDDYGIKNLKIL
jgi:hypothetical protein